MPQLLCLLLHFGLKRYSPCFYGWVMTTYCFKSIKQLGFDTCTQWKTVARATSSCAHIPHSPASQCSPGQLAGFIIKATLQKVLFPFTTALQYCHKRNTHLRYSGVVGKSHRNVLASHRNIAWECVKVYNKNIPNERAVHKGSFQLLSEHVLRTKFDGNCLPW